MPLTAGFIGKVLVFRPALEAGNTLITILVVVAVLGSAISAYYYLRLIVVMFFRERTSDWHDAKDGRSDWPPRLVITVLGVFYFGIFGDSVISKFAQSPAAPIVKAER